MFTFNAGFLKAQLYDQSKKSGEEETDQQQSNFSMGAFVLFETHQDALVAKERLAGHMFDVELQATLQSRLAMKNLVLTREERELHVKRRRVQQLPQIPIDMRNNPYFPAMSNVYDPYRQQAALQSFPHSIPQPEGSYLPAMPGGGNPFIPHALPQFSDNGFGGGFKPSNAGRNYEQCNTLFLSRFDMLPFTDLLQHLTSNCPGFKDHKVINDSRGQQVCFVEFEGPELAAAAMPALETLGVRVSFAKNPLNKRSRD
jgi:hypothetical protein